MVAMYPSLAIDAARDSNAGFRGRIADRSAHPAGHAQDSDLHGRSLRAKTGAEKGACAGL
jgi:hypothetical protein